MTGVNSSGSVASEVQIRNRQNLHAYLTYRKCKTVFCPAHALVYEMHKNIFRAYLAYLTVSHHLSSFNKIHVMKTGVLCL